MKKTIGITMAVAALSGALITGATAMDASKDNPIDYSAIAQEVTVPGQTIMDIENDLRLRNTDAVKKTMDEHNLAPEQIQAVAANDFTLETYTKLVELEAAELRANGFDVTEIMIDNPNGYEAPNYGWRVEDNSGISAYDAAKTQMQIQEKYRGVYQGLYDNKFNPLSPK